MSYSDNATKQQVQPAITTATRSLNKDRGITDDTFVVKLDALLMSDQALQELAKAMVVISDCHCKLHLCINKLGVTCNGAKKTAVLLREIDHQELHGLCLKFNALTCVDLVGLAPSIKSLVNLTAIDLSCNNINFYLSDTTCDLISEVFKHLRQLSRLDLSNNRIKTKLRRLLAEIPQSLTYLRLAACGLTVTDITYLARSHHCEHLTELDLSENGLGRACTYVVQLLYALSKNLRVLEIEDSFLKDEHILAIEPAVRSMESLLYINVAENVFSRNMQKLLTKAISGIQSMQVFRLSYASDCYLFESNEEESNAQSQNLKELEELAVRHTEKSSQLKIEIIELCRGH